MCWKAEEVSYDVDIKSFQRLPSIQGQKFRFLSMLNFVQNRILVALLNSKTYKY
jgi:hypothetical protein